MNEAITSLESLTPIGAILVLAALAQVAIVQIAKRQHWTKGRTQAVALAVAGFLGLLAALVLGRIVGVPDSVIQGVASVLVSIASVAVLGRALYGVVGYVIPDGSIPEPSPAELAAAQARLARESRETRTIAISSEVTANDARAVAEAPAAAAREHPDR